MLHRNEQWLLQLRDDVETIIHPGHWGLFGGHLEPGETAEEAVQRELEEEISWCPSAPSTMVQHKRHPRRSCLPGALTVPTTDLHLKEGQDLRLVSLEELRSGSIWSDHCGEARPIAPGLQIVLPVC